MPSTPMARNDRAAGAPPLNEPTYMRIKRAIVADLISTYFRPGDHLTIDMLTSRYAVSHMPIREALRQLEGEGILISLAHRGFRIEAISADYIRNIYDIRVGIESMLARRATERKQPGDAERLMAINERYAVEVHAPDTTAAVQTNIEFHAALYAIAGNLEAEQLLEGRTRIVRTVAQTLDGYLPQDRRAIVVEHAAILDAFAAGDAEGCGQAVFDHVTRARDRLLARLARAEPAWLYQRRPSVGA